MQLSFTEKKNIRKNFGRLKEILGNRDDLRIVGDRFIFESELLFDSGSATLQEEGKNNIRSNIVFCPFYSQRSG